MLTREGLRKQYLRLIDNHEEIFQEHILLIAYLHYFYGSGGTSSSSFGDPFEELKPRDHGEPSLLFHLYGSAR